MGCFDFPCLTRKVNALTKTAITTAAITILTDRSKLVAENNPMGVKVADSEYVPF